MLLSDVDIERAIETGDLGITPFEPSMLQPASVELRLGDEFVTFCALNNEPLNPLSFLEADLGATRITGANSIILMPGDSVLGHTREMISLSGRIGARVEGKSSLGRHFMLVHSTAGFIDPGFEGQITLEISNLNRRPLVLTAGMRIAQIAFERLSSHVGVAYGSFAIGSHYQRAKGVGLPQPLRP